MQETKPATKAVSPVDRGETEAVMMPLTIGQTAPERAALSDQVVALVARSSGFQHSLPQGIASALAELVRAMNCYYSNLIEGHATHPVDIERALRDELSEVAEQRDLQLEARAHIAVQAWIDAGGLQDRLFSREALCAIHERFAAELPERLLWIDHPDTDARERVIPGALRSRDVCVGRHMPPSPGAIARLLGAYGRHYAPLGTMERLLAAAAAHHRLLWIHPFLDGNGRVARLHSHALFVEVLATGGVWSVARGLARQVDAYKGHLAACDAPRRNDLDGRGALSQAALVAFSAFFLETCLDQVQFMEGLVEPRRLRERVLRWADEAHQASRLPPRADRLLEVLLFQGTLNRAEVPGLLDASERQSRRVVAALINEGAIRSASSRAPLHLAFPAHLAECWLPGLFPAQATPSRRS